jgi:uncharacterized protein
MYRTRAVSLRSKLERLDPQGLHGAPPAPPTPVAVESTDRLATLRQRIEAIVTRTSSPRPARVGRTGEPVDLPFTRTETSVGPLYSRSVVLSAAHRTGHAPVLPARDASSTLLSLLALDPSLATAQARGALYLDTETTGLAGGTGTVAFLVGLAFWSGAHETSEGELVVEQLFVPNLGEEAPMLEHLAKRIAQASMLVTFNGKSFDIPLMKTRFTMARMAVPMMPPHLDLLHVARRLHKVRKLECRLTNIERHVLGFERVDDVAGAEVSGRYREFLRSGDPAPLLGVLEHNVWDVVAMASLVGLYGEPLEASTLAPEDLVGVAETLARAGEHEQAYSLVSRVIDGGERARHDALRARARLSKARGDRARAMADFEVLVATVDEPDVRLELAKLYEHYVRAPERALSLTVAGTGETPLAATKRKRRLVAKVERAAASAGPSRLRKRRT